MKYRSICPHCQARYVNVPPQAESKKTRCRKCQQVFVIQLEPDEAEAPAMAGMKPARLDNSNDLQPVPGRVIKKRPVPDPGRTVLVEPAPTVPNISLISKSRSTPPPEPLDWDQGEVILNLYKVLKVLGQGGMGRVYQVRHLGWGLDLAVKTPTPEALAAAGGIEDFEHEAETWVNLGLHPQTVTCHYVRRVGDVPCLFAEYLAGGSLHDWIYGQTSLPGRLYAGGPGPALARILDVAIQFAWGLDYAHEQGLVHQDVKPANLLLGPRGQAKVTDFGLARLRVGLAELPELAAEKTPGSSKSCPGTPQYFAPEQAAGGLVTRQADIWGWGLCLLEMFKGGRTWESGTVAAAALSDYLAGGPGTGWLPAMPARVGDLLKGVFQFEPRDRPESLGSLAEELIEIYSQVIGQTYVRPRPKAGQATAGNLNNRAVSLLDLGRSLEAENLWAQSLEVQPHHPESTYNCRLFQWRTGRVNDDVLLRDMAEVHRSHRQSLDVPYFQALIHLERDDCPAALEAVQTLQPEKRRRPEVRAVIQVAQKRHNHSQRLLASLTGHDGPVNAVALGPDGHLVFSAGEDRTIRVWETSSGQLFRTIDIAEGPIECFSLSEDGRYLLFSGGEFSAANYTVRFCDANSGRQLKVFRGHEKRVLAVCLSREGTFALTVSDDQTVRWWETTTGQCRRTLTGLAGQATSAWLSPDGRHALMGHMDKTIKLWSLEDGRSRRSLAGHEDRINSIDVDGRLRYCLTGGADRTVKLWDLAGGRLIKSFLGHRGEVHAVRLSPDGRFALSGGSDQTIKLWAVDTGRCLRTFEGHESWVLSLDLSRDGKMAASGGLDKTIRLWRLEGRHRTYQAPMMLVRVEDTETTLAADERFARDLAAARAALAQGQPFQAAQSVRSARAQPGYERSGEAMSLWADLYLKLPRGEFQGAWEGAAHTGHDQEIKSLSLSRDGNLYLTGSVGESIRVVETATSRTLLTLLGHEGPVNAVCWSDDGRWILSGSTDKMVRLWEVATGRCQQVFTGHIDRVNAVHFGPHPDFAMSAGGDRVIKVWELATGRLAGELTGHKSAVNSIDLSLDGRLALTAAGDHYGKDSVLRLWDLTSGRELLTLTGHERAVNAACFRPNASQAVSGGSDGTIRIWDLNSGTLLDTLVGHAAAVTSISISTSGRWILSGSYDQTIKIWDIHDGRCRRTFEGHNGPVSTIAFSQDGRLAISSSEDRTVKLWVLDWALEAPPETDWDEGARPWLLAFIQALASSREFFCRPYHEPDKTPDLSWSDDQWSALLSRLGGAGYGWLDPEIIRERLVEIIAGAGQPEKIDSPPEKTPSTRTRPAPADGWLGAIKRNIGRYWRKKD